MKKTLKRVLAVILVLALSLTALAAVASAAPAADRAESASVAGFFKKLANAIKGIIDKIFGGDKPEPKPEPDTTAPVQPTAPAEEPGFEFVRDSGKLDYVGDFH